MAPEVGCIAVPRHGAALLQDGTCPRCYPAHGSGPTPVSTGAARYCTSCGARAQADGAYCARCGNPVAGAGPRSVPGGQQVAPYRRPAAPRLRIRPGQLTAAAVLMFVMGGFNLLGSVLYIAVGNIAGVLVVIGVVLLVIGGFELWIGTALLQMRGWARVAGIVMAAITGLLGLISLVGGEVLSIVSVGLAIAVLILLCGEEARDAATW